MPTLEIITRPLDKDMTYEQVQAEIRNRIYQASLIFEELENLGLVHGNGHHMAQRMIQTAEEQLRIHWRIVSSGRKAP